MEDLESALEATRLVLEENPSGDHHEATMNPFRSGGPRRALNYVLNALKANFWFGDLPDLVSDLKDATNEIFVCQRNNERAFKFV